MDQSFNETFGKAMKSDSFLLKEIVRFRMERFLALEQDRRVAQILMLEKKIKEKIIFPGSKKQFNFVLKVDRVDKLEDGSLLILDYKTGGAELKPRSIDKIKAGGFNRTALKSTVGSFQLPLYLYFVRKSLFPQAEMNAAIYNLRTAQLDYFLKEEDYSRIKLIEEVFLEAFNSLIIEIIDPKTGFSADDQDSRYCRNCPFFYLCR